MTTTEVEEQKQTVRTPLLRMQIGLSFFSFILIGANDGAIGVLIPSMRTHYDINNATIGLLFLFATAGYLIASFNTGLLAEKLGYRRFLLVGVSVFLCAVLIMSLMPPFIVLLFMLLPLGFGGAILDGGQNAYIAALPRNSALLNYLHAFYGIGALLGPIIASALLVIGFQWNSVYVVWVVWSVILLIGISFTFRSQISPANVNAENTNKAIAKRNVLLTALTTRVVWLGALFLFLYVGAEASLGSWSYSFLTEIRHGTPLLMGWVVSGYWMGLTLSRLTLAKVSQSLGEKRLIQYCIAGVIAGVLLIWLVPIGAVSALGLCLTGFSLGPIFPTTIALMSRMVSPRILASAIGFLTSFGAMGAALFPFLAGSLAQAIGLWSLLPYVIILTIVMLCLWVLLQTRPGTSPT